ncbi:putative conserved transmembrane protein [Nostocoides japonicum T1-X7]|uniref:Putative conserved transmembrane protein n=1 Tax=Nostocoides japonicum T1-X7 TaxID=1194083 RepID=A0A077LXC0_9MICO|nr:DUF3054 domain-containing protein [Tetrasphaera japonica]CCH76570.1 putative conserved transmembrane protein [Tetrasphaera japonica T1-X7]
MVRPVRRRADASAWAVDAVAVILFAAVGRISHGEGLTLNGLIDTAGPFLGGVLVAWLVIDWQRWEPYAWRTGILVLACVIVVGMVLRSLLGQGVQPSFVVVATLVLALLLLGWRLVARRREA